LSDVVFNREWEFGERARLCVATTILMEVPGQGKRSMRVACF
jgi:hypothetical protein